ncbi:MAG: single-stranded DNA-binding protein [Deltaproteobacteria bacterium]|nr:single-stranded DNA-binding protein [Deltaproteobacteria bacterium]
MASVNKVILIGNLGQDPEKRVTGSGQTVCTFSIATTDRWSDKGGQAQERTEWHRIVVWGPQAENCAQYLAKGRQAYIEGRLQTRQWEDKEGHKRTTTEVVAQRVQFLGGPRSGDTVTSRGASADTNPGFDQAGSDDVPF